jgi:hypothetical protein
MAMEIDVLIFTRHAVEQMFRRRIAAEDVRIVVRTGELIADYPDDQPYPSRLILGHVGGRPLHVVLAWEAETKTGYVVTAYEPDLDLWEPGFRARRKP